MKIINVKPNRRGSQKEQLCNCLDQLTERLRASNLGLDRILKISVFFHPELSKAYLCQRKDVEKNFKEYFGIQFPAFSVISDFPEDDYIVALEAFVSENINDSSLERKTFNGFRYAVLKTQNTKEIYAAGITIGDYEEEATDMFAHAEYAFSIASGLLESEGLTLNTITRSWNYMEDIIGTDQCEAKTYQNYQVFNDVRSSYFDRCDFKNGYPAATGIGMFKGGVVIEFIASSLSDEVQVKPIKNKLQSDAYLYTEKVLVGCSYNRLSQISTPKFERAKLVIEDTSRTLFISGTASILNEETVAPESVEEQTRISLNHIDLLIKTQTDGCWEFREPKDLCFRVYVKREEDLPIVRSICESRFGKASGQYLIADICRAELLVEIECICLD